MLVVALSVYPDILLPKCQLKLEIFLNYIQSSASAVIPGLIVFYLVETLKVDYSWNVLRIIDKGSRFLSSENVKKKERREVN